MNKTDATPAGRTNARADALPGSSASEESAAVTNLTNSRGRRPANKTITMSSAPSCPSFTRPRGDSIGSLSSSVGDDEPTHRRPTTATSSGRRASPKVRPKDLHPVVASMVSGNILRDCHQVKDFYGHCLTKSTTAATDSYVCQTAARYHDICTMEGGI